MLLRLHDTSGFSIQIQQIVRKAVTALEWKVSEHHSPACHEIGALVVLNFPASLFKRLVDMIARAIFGGGHAPQNTPFPKGNHLGLRGCEARCSMLNGEVRGGLRAIYRVFCWSDWKPIQRNQRNKTDQRNQMNQKDGLGF